jgi:predicted dienelactone hydrolase
MNRPSHAATQGTKPAAAPSPATHSPGFSRRSWLLGAAACGVLAFRPRTAWGQDLPEAAIAPDLPRAAQAAFTVQDFDWLDSSRQRAVPARLYLPESMARVPLVVFSHGIGGSREGYSYLGRHWASHGLASLHLQHVGSDRQIWRGSALGLPGRLAAAAQDSEAVARVADVSYGLDQIAREAGVSPRLDLDRIAAAGHSYGANTALLAVGATVERQGQAVRLIDARVRAAVLLSAPPFYGEQDLRRVLAPVQVPSLHVTTTEDTIRVPGYFSDAADRIALFEAMGHPNKTLAVFEGGSHSIFTDRRSGSAELNERVKQATASLTLAFLRASLLGERQALQQWPQQHQVLLSRFVAPSVIAAAA